MRIFFRWANENDMAELRQLTDCALAHAGRQERMGEKERQELLQLIRTQCVLIALREDFLMGYLAYTDCRRWEELPRGLVHLTTLHCHPEATDEVREELHKMLVTECGKYNIEKLTAAVPFEDNLGLVQMRGLGYELGDTPQLLKRFPLHHHLVFKGELKTKEIDIVFLEDSLPAKAKDGRVAFAKEHSLPLEVSYESWETKGWIYLYEEFDVEVISLRAIAMTEHHLLHKDKHHRFEAKRLLENSMEVGRRLGAKRVTAFFAPSLELADNPFDRAVDLFSEFAEQARALDLKIDIMAAPRRSSPFFSTTEDVQQLLDALDDDETFGLRLNSDEQPDLDSFFTKWKREVAHLQLNELENKPDFERWWDLLGSRPDIVTIICPRGDDANLTIRLLDELRTARDGL